MSNPPELWEFDERHAVLLAVYEHIKNPEELAQKAILEYMQENDFCENPFVYFAMKVDWCKKASVLKKPQRDSGFLHCDAYENGFVKLTPMGGSGQLWFFPNGYIFYYRYNYGSQ